MHPHFFLYPTTGSQFISCIVVAVISKIELKNRSQTMQNQVKIDNWVSMFREIGLDDEAAMRWHRLFESRYPESHQSFLEWLGLCPEKIEEIRTRSR